MFLSMLKSIMFEKSYTPESIKPKSFLKALLLSGGIVVSGFEVPSASAQEAINKGVLSYSELSMEQVKKLPFDPLVLKYADKFYRTEINPNASFTEIFKDMQALDITGEDRKAVIDGDGIVLIVNSFEQHREGDCKWDVNDSSLPIVFYSETPEICEFEAFYFPNIELTS